MVDFPFSHFPQPARTSGRDVASPVGGKRTDTWYVSKSLKCENYRILLIMRVSALWAPVNKEQPFKDKCFLYRFRADEEGSPNSPTTEDVNSANEHIREALTTLLHRGPDATLRMILRKP